MNNKISSFVLLILLVSVVSFTAYDLTRTYEFKTNDPFTISSLSNTDTLMRDKYHRHSKRFSNSPRIVSVSATPMLNINQTKRTSLHPTSNSAYYYKKNNTSSYSPVQINIVKKSIRIRTYYVSSTGYHFRGTARSSGYNQHSIYPSAVAYERNINTIKESLSKTNSQFADATLMAQNSAVYQNTNFEPEGPMRAGADDDDPFDPGAGEDDPNGYAGVPVGDGGWFLVLMAMAYGCYRFWRRGFRV